MTTPMLTTKLYIPPARLNLVARPRLLERLNAGLERRLTLISAPAGFGKSTLVSAWLSGCGLPVAWLALDAGDSDPRRFLAYLVAALQTIAPALGDGVLAALQSPQPPPLETLLSDLLNEIALRSDRFVLVLDDYHSLDAETVDHALSALIEHQPPALRLVIATREDPALPLARLRAQGQLTELRAADLRFTADETAAFLNQAMGLALSSEDITTLERRTEGWIAGLQLAALAMQGMQGQQDVSGFIQTFAGDHRYIVDYLVDEVLDRQSTPMRDFLLQTAILDRLIGPLCDAVTGRGGGSARLVTLERGNFFVVPLDDQRHWYRYHHLFADVLRAHLLVEQSEHVATLHRRASAWHEQHGAPADAIQHALAAEDFARAAGLIERALPAMRQSRQEAEVLGWLRAIPDDVVRQMPMLSALYAHTLLATGEMEGVEPRLQDAERWLDTTADNSDNSAIVAADAEEYRLLRSTILLARAAQAMALGAVADTMTFAWQVLELSPADDHLSRGAGSGLLGLAFWAGGDLETAHRVWAEGMDHLHRAGHISDALGCAIALADIRIGQGRLREAMRTYEQALELATQATAQQRQGNPVLRGTADMYVGMSELYCERNDLEAAAEHLLRAQGMGDRAGLPQYPHRWRVAMARIRAAQGDLDGALDLLHEAERRYVSDFFPNVRPIAAVRARIWIVQGRLSDSLAWAREQGLLGEEDLSYPHEFEHITLARLLLAQFMSDHADGSLHEAMGLLARLLAAAEAGMRMGSVIEILMLQALAHQMHDDFPAALVSLERALTLAETEGYVRLFADEGSPMAALLEVAAKRGVAPNYASHLLSAMGAARPGPSAKPGLIEPLSERERDVLRLLITDLSGPEIAQELVVSLNTLRTHTKSIYSKLGVNSRRAALRRARELGLL